MNFFGHAAVASWSSADDGVVLGAMLPDFATMCRGRLAAQDDPQLADGIARHHAADAVFHRLPPALALMRELDERLARGGCARGPRRAASHVGVELLLDGILVEESAYRAAYTAGIACATPPRWRDDGDAERFAVLIARLRAHGAPDDLRSPLAIAQRLHRMLAHRPLLAPSDGDLRAIERGLVEHRPRVAAAAATVLRGLRAALDA